MKQNDEYDGVIGFVVVATVVGVIAWWMWPERTRNAEQSANHATQEVVEVIDVGPPVVLTSPGLESRQREYVGLCYPDGSIDYRLGEPNYDRNVTVSMKKKIIERDGNKCVICGATKELEVDHMRALMNGGDNSPSNLACLCAYCNKSVVKSTDNSFRRQREKRLKEMRYGNK